MRSLLFAVAIVLLWTRQSPRGGPRAQVHASWLRVPLGEPRAGDASASYRIAGALVAQTGAAGYLRHIAIRLETGEWDPSATELRQLVRSPAIEHAAALIVDGARSDSVSRSADDRLFDEHVAGMVVLARAVDRCASDPVGATREALAVARFGEDLVRRFDVLGDVKGSELEVWGLAVARECALR